MENDAKPLVYQMSSELKGKLVQDTQKESIKGAFCDLPAAAT